MPRVVLPCPESYVAVSITNQQQLGNQAEGEHQIVASASMKGWVHRCHAQYFYSMIVTFSDGWWLLMTTPRAAPTQTSPLRR